MDRKAAKELLHVQGWLERVDEIIQRAQDAYLADDLLQELIAARCFEHRRESTLQHRSSFHLSTDTAPASNYR